MAWGMIAFSVLNFLAVRVRDPAGLVAIIGSEIALQFLSIYVNLRALQMDLIPSSAWGAVGMHVVLCALYTFFLVTRNRAPVPAATPA